MSKIHLLNYGACTGCFGRIATAISRIKDHEMKEEAYIAMGPNVKPIEEKGRIFLCGNCAAPSFYNKLKGTFIPGCPPDLKGLLEEIRKMGGITK